MMNRQRLPTLDHRQDATAYCSYCPKLCRHTCPVSTAQGRETTTPWGKMHIAHRANAKELPPHEGYSNTSYACTGCMRCTTACDHDNDVAETLLVARQDGGVHAALGKDIHDLRRLHQMRTQKASAAGASLDTMTAQKPTGSVLFIGCTSLVKDKRDAQAHARGHAALAGTGSACSATSCCGLPLLEAGDLAGFVDAANKFWKKHSKAETVVFSDPGCQHALLKRAPELGVQPPQKQRHVDLLTFFDSHGSRIRPLAGAPPLYYKDPCRLGRGLGVYQAPRRLIEKLTEQRALEFDYAESDATCSGAGGQLPRTYPETASEIARESIAPAQDAWIATACAASKAHLLQNGGRCVDLAALVGQSLAPDGEKLPWNP